MFVRWFNIYYEQTYCSLLGKIQCTHKIFAVRNFLAVNSSEQRFKHGRSMQVSYIQKIRTVDLLSALAPVTLMLLSCSPNLPCASITRHLHSKNVPTVVLGLIRIPPTNRIRDPYCKLRTDIFFRS